MSSWSHSTRQAVVGHHLLDVLEYEIDDVTLAAEQVAQAGGDDVLERQLVDHLGDGVTEVVHHQQGGGIGVAQLVLELAGGVQRVDVDHGQAGTQRGEDRDRVLDAVGHHDRQAITLLELELALQVGGELFNQHIQLGIADFLAETGQGGHLGKTLDRGVEHIADGLVLFQVDVGRDACRVVVQPGTLMSHFPLQRKLLLIGGRCAGCGRHKLSG